MPGKGTILSFKQVLIGGLFFSVSSVSFQAAGLKVKALEWKRNCETSSRIKFIVWKRNCVTSKPQYFPCVEAELRHFRAPSHTLFCIFLMRRRNFKPKNIPCVERKCRTSSHIIVCVRKRNFKSHNSLYVDSLWFLIQ